VVYKVTLGQQRERLTKGLVLVNTAVGQANVFFTAPMAVMALESCES
jgi:hypothetical protein